MGLTLGLQIDMRQEIKRHWCVRSCFPISWKALRPAASPAKVALKRWMKSFALDRKEFRCHLDFLLCLLHEEYIDDCLDFYENDGPLFVQCDGVTPELVARIDQQILGCLISLMVLGEE